ncbi:preprotein translocase subunit SecG [Clostridium sp.]|uniref:preprotein translocase subunit SecG n=1 Tax=Clostridium sp. TaxID=1506 RepID=UPI002FC69C52
MLKVLMAVLIISALTVIISIILQPSKTSGLNNLISGTSETFYSRNKTKTKEAFLAKVTVFSAIILVLSVILINVNLG